MKVVFLPKSITSGLEIAIYSYTAALLHSSNLDHAYISPRMFVHYFLDDTARNRSAANKAIVNLIDSGCFSGKEIDKHFYTVSIPKNTSYDVINFSDIVKLTNSPLSYKFDIIKLYAEIMRSRSYKTKQCTMPMSYFENRLDMSHPTVTKYLSVLEEMSIFKISKTYIPAKTTNTICHTCDDVA